MSKEEAVTASTMISVVDGGPLVVRGPKLATDAEGSEFRIRHKAVLLRRCGTSRNKPFCDGSHVKMASGPSREWYATPRRRTRRLR